jgi:probable HAF family extracellular repeat protein
LQGFILVPTSLLCAQPAYTIRDLGTLGGQTTFTFAGASERFRNDAGQIVGGSQVAPPTPFSSTHAFLWDPVTGMQDLGTLGGSFSMATAINDEGRVVGESNIQGDLADHAFTWRDGIMTDLGTLPGDTRSRAVTIDSDGQIYGYSCHDNPPFITEVCHFVIWTPSEHRDGKHARRHGRGQ